MRKEARKIRSEERKKRVKDKIKISKYRMGCEKSPVFVDLDIILIGETPSYGQNKVFELQKEKA